MSNQGPISGRRFDKDHGVTTQAILFLEDLDPDTIGDARAHATHYEAVPIEDFKAMLASIPPDAILKSTFIDIGAGMGRAILLASEYPFKQIVGIEVSPSLHEIAKENLKTASGLRKACDDITLIRADARMHTYPPGNLVVFLYNPFDEISLQQTIESIKQSRNEGDAVHILYHTPVHESALTPRTRIAEFPNALVIKLVPGGHDA